MYRWLKPGISAKLLLGDYEPGVRGGSFSSSAGSTSELA
jgi:hypothetical protein